MSRLRVHDALIRRMAGEGETDQVIADAVGASATGIYLYRQREGITSGDAPSERSEAAQRFHLQECDDMFAVQMRGQRFASVLPGPVGRITGRCDPAIGMGASSAYSCAQAGQSSYWKNRT